MIDNDNAIQKIARIHDRATGKYLDVIEFPVSGLQTGRLELAPSVVNDLKVFERNLLDADAKLEKEKEQRRQQLEAVAQSDAPEQWVYEDHTGWIQNGKAFVMADGVVGDAETNIVGVNRSKGMEDRCGQLSLQGGWKDWRKMVAEPARTSTTLMFAISSALAAPLVSVTGQQSFSLNLFGPTRAGKTMASLIAASVIGIGRREDLITWKITDARLGERLPEFNDALFPIDDLDNIEGSEKEKCERIRDLAYTISQGQPKAKHSSYTLAHEGAYRRWSSILLTSCQFSIRELAKKANTEREPGEALRLIDVPATFDGQDHIFDLLPAGGNNVEEWKERAFVALRQACKQNHGKPFRKYLKALIARRETLKEEVGKSVDAFVESACDKFDGAVARDVAHKFGLIYAGGLLGIQCHLLLWKETELRAAILKCFKAAKSLLPDKGVLLRSGIEALKTHRRGLQKVSMPHRRRDAKSDYETLPGYRFSTPSHNHYRIKVEAYVRIFASREQRDLVTNWLIGKNRLTLAQPQHSTENVGRKPQEQFVWPDGKRRRSIEMVWARKTTGETKPQTETTTGTGTKPSAESRTGTKAGQKAKPKKNRYAKKPGTRPR